MGKEARAKAKPEQKAKQKEKVKADKKIKPKADKKIKPKADKKTATIKTEVTKEKKRLVALLSNCGVSKNKIDMLETIIENVAWQKVKLDDAMEQIKHTSVAIPYDNGGGQTGIRENPLFKGYESLYRTYMAGMAAIMANVPQEEVKKAESEETPKTVLQLIREKHKPA